MTYYKMSNADKSTESNVHLGRVKWFNNKQGYGFVTILEGEHEGLDVFTHHSAIKVATEQYRYLTQGEYVSFSLKESEDKNHKFSASDVTGVLGGMLMCETKFLMKSTSREEGRDTGRSRSGSGKWNVVTNN